ncbi:MAG: hypothetical protein ACN6P8_11190, partial [Achromobacter piechaudii]
MSITYRPPFDEDDERDLRALYRKPRPGSSPELDAAVRRTWHPGHSWHPGWAAAACAAMVAGLFAWTDMREAADMQETSAPLTATRDSSADRTPAPVALTDALATRQPAPVAQRVAAPQADAAVTPTAPSAPVTAAVVTQDAQVQAAPAGVAQEGDAA